MKLQCLFSHPVTSVFVWSAWPTMKKPRKRKYQQIRDLTVFPVIQLSLLHKHRIISSLVNISNRLVVTEFVYAWSFCFRMDFCCTLFWGQVLWLDLGFFAEEATFRKRTLNSYLMIHLDPSLLLTHSYSIWCKYKLKNLFFLCLWATTTIILLQFSFYYLPGVFPTLRNPTTYTKWNLSGS